MYYKDSNIIVSIHNPLSPLHLFVFFIMNNVFDLVFKHKYTIINATLSVIIIIIIITTCTSKEVFLVVTALDEWMCLKCISFLSHRFVLEVKLGATCTISTK